MQEFTLDEKRAAAWLARAVAQFEPRSAGETSQAPELELSASYDPHEDDGGATTYDIVAGAKASGLITGPGEIAFDYDDDSEGEIGYTWLVYLDGPGSLKLFTYYSKIRHLGGQEPGRGADAALAVLREAVSAGNQLLADLDGHIASRR